MGGKDHWQAVYSQKAPDKVSWYQMHLECSLSFVYCFCRCIDD